MDYQNADKFFVMAYKHLMKVQDREAKIVLAYAIGIGIEMIRKKRHG